MFAGRRQNLAAVRRQININHRKIGPFFLPLLFLAEILPFKRLTVRQNILIFGRLLGRNAVKRGIINFFKSRLTILLNFLNIFTAVLNIYGITALGAVFGQFFNNDVILVKTVADKILNLSDIRTVGNSLIDNFGRMRLGLACTQFLFIVKLNGLGRQRLRQGQSKNETNGKKNFWHNIKPCVKK